MKLNTEAMDSSGRYGQATVTKQTWLGMPVLLTDPRMKKDAKFVAQFVLNTVVRIDHMAIMLSLVIRSSELHGGISGGT